MSIEDYIKGRYQLHILVCLEYAIF